MGLHTLTVLGSRLGAKALTRMAVMRPPCVGRLASVRMISSTDKTSATHVGVPPNTVIDNPPRTAEDFAEAAVKPRNWISYGYSEENIETDRDTHAFIMFCLMSICVVGICFFVGYAPDLKEADWSHREAYLELARREKRGLPLIDKEFIPVERINLPSEEELVGKRVFL